MTCWSCENYRIDDWPADIPFCRIAREGFPDIGRACPAFCYDVGSDEKERDIEQTNLHD